MRPSVPGSNVPVGTRGESGSEDSAPAEFLGLLGVVARRARDIDTNEAVALVHRNLADQASIAYPYAGDGYDLSVYDSKFEWPFVWRDDITIEDISDDMLMEYWDGALKRLPLAVDQFNHAAAAVAADPTVEVGVGHLMEALDRIVDTVGTLKVVSDAREERNSAASQS